MTSSTLRPRSGTRRPRRVSSPNRSARSRTRGSLSRYEPSTITRRVSAVVARNRSNSSDGSSAAWRSSRTIITGCSLDTSSRNAATSSNSRKRSASGSAADETDERRGERVVASSFAGASASKSPPAARTTWTHGQYAGAPPPSQHRPSNTDQPSALADAARTSISRLLPIPGSPQTRKTAPWPSLASANAAPSSSSSRVRPTNGRTWSAVPAPMPSTPDRFRMGSDMGAQCRPGASARPAGCVRARENAFETACSVDVQRRTR